ncbi:MAG TPA: hypothetical protein VES66_06585 [Terriglobales bacterium]|nr:hypothetical protein [Terriglobales bacterium]
MKRGIRDFHAFVMGPLIKAIREKYERYEIVSEADLQAVAWHLIARYFEEGNSTGQQFKVLNKPYCKDLRIHPDLVVFKRSQPWAVLELKERKLLTRRSAQREWERLIKARNCLRPRRAYLVYVARYGRGRLLRGPKGRGARYFFEVPIVLQDIWTDDHISAWEAKFRFWSKFVSVNADD